jgi:hypothetical protein
VSIGHTICGAKAAATTGVSLIPGAKVTPTPVQATTTRCKNNLSFLWGIEKDQKQESSIDIVK